MKLSHVTDQMHVRGYTSRTEKVDNTLHEVVQLMQEKVT